MLKFKILGIPQAKQSARFRALNLGSKTIVQSYQSKAVKDNERNLSFDIKSQLPVGFVPIDNALAVKVSFVFPVQKSMSKKQISIINNGQKVYKTTKPDLVDNLMKGLFDAMKGIVFTDDARICKTETEKVYGPVPMTLIEIESADIVYSLNTAPMELVFNS